MENEERGLREDLKLCNKRRWGENRIDATEAVAGELTVHVLNPVATPKGPMKKVRWSYTLIPICSMINTQNATR